MARHRAQQGEVRHQLATEVHRLRAAAVLLPQEEAALQPRAAVVLLLLAVAARQLQVVVAPQQLVAVARQLRVEEAPQRLAAAVHHLPEAAIPLRPEVEELQQRVGATPRLLGAAAHRPRTAEGRLPLEVAVLLQAADDVSQSSNGR